MEYNFSIVASFIKSIAGYSRISEKFHIPEMNITSPKDQNPVNIKKLKKDREELLAFYALLFQRTSVKIRTIKLISIGFCNMRELIKLTYEPLLA